MQAVILVGGQGTRLRPLTATRPKPMMPLVDRPFVAHQIEHLTRYGIHDVVFSCGYRPDALEAYFGDGARFGVRVRYVTDPIPLGTAGAVANAVPAFDHPDDVLVLNGDILTDLDLEAFRRAHVSAGAAGSIALTPVTDPSAYGLVRLREDRAVSEFLEKPSDGRAHPRRALPDQCGDLHLVPGGDRDDPVRSRLRRSSARSSRSWPSRGVCSGIRATPTGATLARPSPIWMPTATCWPARSSTADVVGDAVCGPGNYC